LAREVSKDVELSLRGLSTYLEEQGLQPPAETLAAFAAQRRRLYGP
jgi:hypothetical protein